MSEFDDSHVYWRDASWHRSPGRADRLHRSRLGDAPCLAACSRLVMLDETMALPLREVTRDRLCRRCFP